jgi:hypothetical protein
MVSVFWKLLARARSAARGMRAAALSAWGGPEGRRPSARAISRKRQLSKIQGARLLGLPEMSLAQRLAQFQLDLARRSLGRTKDRRRHGASPRDAPKGHRFPQRRATPWLQKTFAAPHVFTLRRSAQRAQRRICPLGRRGIEDGRMDDLWARPDCQGGALRLKNAWAFGPHGVRPACLVRPERYPFLRPLAFGFLAASRPA